MYGVKNESTTPTQSIGVCCYHKVVAVGFNTLCYDAASQRSFKRRRGY